MALEHLTKKDTLTPAFGKPSPIKVEGQNSGKHSYVKRSKR